MTTTQLSDAERKAQKRLGSAANVTLLIGIATVMLGIFSQTLDTRVWNRADVINVPIGVVMLVLSFFIRRCSLAALWLAIGLYGVTGVLNLVNIASTGSPSQYALGTLVARIIFLIPLIQGIGAIHVLDRPVAPAAPESPQAIPGS